MQNSFTCTAYGSRINKLCFTNVSTRHLYNLKHFNLPTKRKHWDAIYTNSNMNRVGKWGIFGKKIWKTAEDNLKTMCINKNWQGCWTCMLWSKRSCHEVKYFDMQCAQYSTTNFGCQRIQVAKRRLGVERSPKETQFCKAAEDYPQTIGNGA